MSLSYVITKLINPYLDGKSQFNLLKAIHVFENFNRSAFQNTGLKVCLDSFIPSNILEVYSFDAATDKEQNKRRSEILISFAENCDRQARANFEEILIDQNKIKKNLYDYFSHNRAFFQTIDQRLAKDFIQYFFSSDLKNAQYQLLKLRRENELRFCTKPLFDKYYDLYCEKFQNDKFNVINFFCESSDLLPKRHSSDNPVCKIAQILSEKEKLLITELKSVYEYKKANHEQIQNHIHALRWGIAIDKVNNSIPDLMSLPLIVQLIQMAQDSLLVKTHFFSEYLQNLSQFSISEADYLNEYILAWNSFSSILVDLDNNFKQILDIFNHAYNEIFVCFQHEPSYSLVRIGVKYWLKIVLNDDLKKKLFRCFENLYLKNCRNNIFYALGYTEDNSVQLQDINQLYTKNCTPANIIELLDNVYHGNRVSIEDFNLKKQLQAFAEAISDVVINPQYLQFLEHSKAPAEPLAKEFENLVIQIRERFFYEELPNFILKNFSVGHQVELLLADHSQLQRMFLRSTYFKQAKKEILKAQAVCQQDQCSQDSKNKSQIYNQLQLKIEQLVQEQSQIDDEVCEYAKFNGVHSKLDSLEKMIHLFSSEVNLENLLQELKSKARNYGGYYNDCESTMSSTDYNNETSDNYQQQNQGQMEEELYQNCNELREKQTSNETQKYKNEIKKSQLKRKADQITASKQQIDEHDYQNQSQVLKKVKKL